MSDEVTPTPEPTKPLASSMPPEMWASMAFAELYTKYKKEVEGRILSAEEEAQAFFKSGVEFGAASAKKLISRAMAELFAEKNKIKDLAIEEEQKMKLQIQMMETFILGEVHRIIPPREVAKPVEEKSPIIQIEKPGIIIAP